jgi:signal transduction histidine kinase
VLLVAKEESGVEPLCRSLERLVLGLGGRCERVSSGTAALAALRQERPLLIALTLELQFSASDELLSVLRQRPDLDDVPVVALVPPTSGQANLATAEHDLVLRAYQQGASDVIGAATPGEVLSAKVTAWLRLAGRAHRLWALRDFAHEARHPIAAIGAAAHLLEVSGDDPAERRRLSHAIVAESERLARMVESYLESDAAMRIGDAPLTETPLHLLRELLAVNLGPALRARVTILAAGELPDLGVDADHLRQMLLNLLDNALAATAGGGAVSIEALVDGDGVALAIRDTGSGIAAEHLERIFDNGFSTRGARHRGLGLGITQRLCSRAGGRIQVSSSPGQGTVFALWLPRALL